MHKISFRFWCKTKQFNAWKTREKKRELRDFLLQVCCQIRATLRRLMHVYAFLKCKKAWKTAICAFLQAFWWCGPGLNRRHMDFQSIALPTELPHLFPFGRAKIRDFSFNKRMNLKFFREILEKLSLMLISIFTQKLNTHYFQLFPVEITVG